jgi:hypothetical protein
MVYEMYELWRQNGLCYWVTNPSLMGAALLHTDPETGDWEFLRKNSRDTMPMPFPKDWLSPWPQIELSM